MGDAWKCVRRLTIASVCIYFVSLLEQQECPGESGENSTLFVA